MKIDYKNISGFDNQTSGGVWMTSSHKLQDQYNEIQSALSAGREIYVQTNESESYRLVSIDENEAELDADDLIVVGGS